MPHVTRGSGTGRKGGVKSRATGGPVEEGEPYLVGEQGPEVVVPKEKGTVIAMEDTKDPFNPLGGRMRPGEGGTSRGGTALGAETLRTRQTLEDTVSEWAKGNMTAKEVQKVFKEKGWTTDLRKGRYGVEAYDPTGRHHILEP
jgi:phage-related minor tail protein